MLKGAGSATWAGPHGRTAASHWDPARLSGSSRVRSAAKSLEHPPSGAGVVCGGTASTACWPCGLPRGRPARDGGTRRTTWTVSRARGGIEDFGLAPERRRGLSSPHLSSPLLTSPHLSSPLLTSPLLGVHAVAGSPLGPRGLATSQRVGYSSGGWPHGPLRPKATAAKAAAT
jgi:hypothetical protein